jgi:cell division protein FtsB
VATRRTPSRPRSSARPHTGRANTRPARSGVDRGRGAGRSTARPRFTNRMAVLVVVAAVLVVSYASSMRAYLEQRSQINDLRAQIASSSKDISTLEREKRRWNDKAYVEAQARERLGWVLPGETSYQVIDRDGKPLERTDDLGDPSSVAKPLPDPWWSKVYGTVESADHPEDIPVPATRIDAPKPTPSP